MLSDTRGMVLDKGHVIDVEFEEDDDIYDIVDGAVTKEVAAACLSTAVELAGFPVTDVDYRKAKGKVIAWMIVNTASGRNNFSKIAHVGVDRKELKMCYVREAMDSHGIDELRRLFVGLLNTAASVVTKSPKLRKWLMGQGRLTDASKAVLAMDSADKLEGLSPRDKRIAGVIKTRRLSRWQSDKDHGSDSLAGVFEGGEDLTD